MDKKNEKILDFSMENLKNSFKIEELKSSFGKKYCATSPDNSIGIIEYHDLEEYLEISILKSRGATEYVLFQPNIDNDVIGILYCTEGALSFSSLDNKETFYIKSGNILIYRRDSEKLKNYRYASRDVGNILIFFHMNKFQERLLKSVNDEAFFEWKRKLLGIFKESVFCYGISNSKLQSTANWIENKSINNIEDYLIFKRMILDFLFQILDVNLNSTEKITLNNIEVVNQTKRILESYPISELPTLKEISKITGLSSYQLNTSFMKSEKITLFQYITKIKMEYAKKLLQENGRNITEISFEIGYENPSKFSKTFRAFFGVLPSKYREMMTNK